MQNRLVLSREKAKYLIDKYGSPLYVYDEDILRKRCQEIKNLGKDINWYPIYSAKANTNIELLKIVNEEGFSVDAMSPGEIVQEEAAGFSKERIISCSNNMSVEEMQFAHEHARILVLDSLQQIEQYGSLYPGTQIGVRLNPGIGAGHNKKVITGGKTKFGIAMKEIQNIKKTAQKYHLTISFLHQHVGSQFLETDVFLPAAKRLLEASENFPDLKEVDFGGGIGIPYYGEKRMNLVKLGKELQELIHQYPSKLMYHMEPGRYIVGECGELLGTVIGVKENEGTLYAGTDIGFNVMMRHVLYGSHHDIAVYGNGTEMKKYTITGNICESGDILGEEMLLEEMHAGDLLGVLDAGAYGFSMASNYNGRLRPAEVLVNKNTDRLIRKRETVADLLQQC